MSMIGFATGTNSSIGVGIAEAVLAMRDSVVATVEDADKQQAIYDEASARTLALAQLDAADQTMVRDVIGQPVTHFWGIDALENNSGCICHNLADERSAQAIRCRQGCAHRTETAGAAMVRQDKHCGKPVEIYRRHLLSNLMCIPPIFG